MVKVAKIPLPNGNYILNFINQPEQTVKIRLDFDGDAWSKEYTFNSLPRNAHFAALKESTYCIGILFKLGFRVNGTRDLSCDLQLGTLIFFDNRKDYLLSKIYSSNIVTRKYIQPKNLVAPKLFYDDDADEKRRIAKLEKESHFDAEDYCFY